MFNTKFNEVIQRFEKKINLPDRNDKLVSKKQCAVNIQNDYLVFLKLENLMTFVPNQIEQCNLMCVDKTSRYTKLILSQDQNRKFLKS